MLILSIFPGINLLGRGFEAAGFCVVRGPDLLWGGDIRNFHPPIKKFDGVIGGSPCQDFSKARRNIPPTGEGREMLSQFVRIVKETQPEWFLLENVPTVPNIEVNDYTIQRLDLNAREVGAKQNRPRHFQFGSRAGIQISPNRDYLTHGWTEPTCMATEGTKKNRRTWQDFCQLQGLPDNFNLPGMTIAAKYTAVGNGVHVQVAIVLAQAIRDAYNRTEPIALCACHCGRIVTGRQATATAACRKRIQRRRNCDLANDNG